MKMIRGEVRKNAGISVSSRNQRMWLMLQITLCPLMTKNDLISDPLVQQLITSSVIISGCSCLSLLFHFHSEDDVPVDDTPAADDEAV